MLGQCVYGLLVPEHAAAFRSLTERVCRGERGTLEFEMIGLKGTRRWMETHAVPFRDEASGETRLLAITRDITERRRAEQALRESEQRFQLFMDNLPANAWIRDAQFRFTYVNRRYAKIWGDAEPGGSLGRDAAELYPPAVAAYFRDSDEKRARAGQADAVRRQPAVRPLAESEIPGARRHGRRRRRPASRVDITERSRLEDALAESERRFRSFMDNAPAIAWIKDASLRYTYVNQPFARVSRPRGSRTCSGATISSCSRPTSRRYFRSARRGGTQRRGRGADGAPDAAARRHRRDTGWR